MAKVKPKKKLQRVGYFNDSFINTMLKALTANENSKKENESKKGV